MKIDYDCMFEEIILALQVLLQFSLTNSIYFFWFLSSSFILTLTRIAWWCSHRIAGSVNLFALYSLIALSFLLKALVSLLYFCVYVCEGDIKFDLDYTKNLQQQVIQAAV